MVQAPQRQVEAVPTDEDVDAGWFLNAVFEREGETKADAPWGWAMASAKLRAEVEKRIT